MKRIGFILMVIVAMAFLMPVSMAQSPQVVDVKGYVYNGGLPVDGARVQIYTWDGQHMGTSPMKTVVSGPIGGVHGAFEFKNVQVDTSQLFSWVVQAESNGAQAHAMVYVAPTPAGENPKAEPIILDLNMWDWKSELTGMVQSGNIAQDALPIPDATIKVYSYSNGTVGTDPVVTTTTDSTGQFQIENSLTYGQYQAVAVTKDNHVAQTTFTAYQQQTPINLVMTDIILATPTPTATPNKNGGNGWLPIPGFEAVFALVAIAGAAFLVARRR